MLSEALLSLQSGGVLRGGGGATIWLRKKLRGFNLNSDEFRGTSTFNIYCDEYM